jgi:diguanylate cyclase (GGDEF)-like protein
MTLDEVIKLLTTTSPKGLTNLQIEVLRLAWEGYTYGEMAETLHYQDAYLKNIASQLWQELSEILKQPISKVNFSSKLKAYTFPLTPREDNNPFTRDWESPYGPVPISSRFYIERPPLENLVKQEITKPGAVIRIKAPVKMGKGSLLLRIIEHAQGLNYQVVKIDLKESDQKVLSNFGLFLRWFCTNLGRQINLYCNLDEYWLQDIGCKVNCNLYLENHILNQLDQPLVLIINDIHHLLKYPKIAQDFFPLLRFWHEQSKQSQVWQKLRLVIVHTIEISLPLQPYQSPFNIGLSVTLPEFTPEQVEELARRYDRLLTQCNPENYTAIQKLIGGHPYLTRLIFEYLCYHNISLDTILHDQDLILDIFADHLRHYLIILQEQPELSQALRDVMRSSHPVKIDSITAYKLESLGLVKLQKDGATPLCHLYRLYFQKEIEKGSLKLSVENYLRQLEIENHRLQNLCLIDELTQIPNQRYFDQTLEQEYQKAVQQSLAISLILCDIDNFRDYNSNYGHLGGDRCLEKIAQLLSDSLLRPGDFVARYGGEEFALILPETDILGAREVITRIQEQIKNLGIIADSNSQHPKMITMSFGLACSLPQPQDSLEILFQEADRALYQAKHLGKNCICISPNLKFSGEG